MITDIADQIPSGRYVIAVSGGVDSMALLHLLHNQAHIKLVVAHFDHGIREDSAEDRRLVQRISKEYKLPFVYDTASLGIGTSEEVARNARYQFLHKVLLTSNAKAIIMAHHQDDLLETAIFNLLRGTGRKGLSSLKSTNIIKRPLTGISKHQIYEYAVANNLAWREDSTNQDLNYKRNYVRHQILPKLSYEQKESLNEIIRRTHLTNQEIDAEIDAYLAEHGPYNVLDRTKFLLLPHKVAMEIMASWLRQNGIRDFNSKLLDSLVIAAKTYKNGQRIDINFAYFLQINSDHLALVSREC